MNNDNIPSVFHKQVIVC